MTNSNTPYSKTSTATLEMLADQYSEIVPNTSDECTLEAYVQITKELNSRK